MFTSRGGVEIRIRILNDKLAVSCLFDCRSVAWYSVAMRARYIGVLWLYR